MELYFFQFPKVLMYGEKYKHLSSDTKLAYMVLKDRPTTITVGCTTSPKRLQNPF